MSAAAGGAGGAGEIAGLRGLGVWRALDAYREGLRGASVAELTGAGGAGYYLRQVALEAVVAEWMRVGSVISAHRALLAGADVVEVAAAMGCSCIELVRVWRAWATGQARLAEQIPGVGLIPAAFALVESRLSGVCESCATGEPPTPGGCGPAGAAMDGDAAAAEMDTHVGSPGS